MIRPDEMSVDEITNKLNSTELSLQVAGLRLLLQNKKLVTAVIKALSRKSNWPVLSLIMLNQMCGNNDFQPHILTQEIISLTKSTLNQCKEKLNSNCPAFLISAFRNIKILPLTEQSIMELFRYLQNIDVTGEVNRAEIKAEPGSESIKVVVEQTIIFVTRQTESDRTFLRGLAKFYGIVLAFAALPINTSVAKSLIIPALEHLITVDPYIVFEALSNLAQNEELALDVARIFIRCKKRGDKCIQEPIDELYHGYPNNKAIRSELAPYVVASARRPTYASYHKFEVYNQCTKTTKNQFQNLSLTDFQRQLFTQLKEYVSCSDLESYQETTVTLLRKFLPGYHALLKNASADSSIATQMTGSLPQLLQNLALADTEEEAKVVVACLGAIGITKDLFADQVIAEPTTAAGFVGEKKPQDAMLPSQRTSSQTPPAKPQLSIMTSELKTKIDLYKQESQKQRSLFSLYTTEPQIVKKLTDFVVDLEKRKIARLSPEQLSQLWQIVNQGLNDKSLNATGKKLFTTLDRFMNEDSDPEIVMKQFYTI